MQFITSTDPDGRSEYRDTCNCIAIPQKCWERRVDRCLGDSSKIGVSRKGPETERSCVGPVIPECGVFGRCHGFPLIRSNPIHQKVSRGALNSCITQHRQHPFT